MGDPLLCSGALPLRWFLSCCFSLPLASVPALHPPVPPARRSPAASPASAPPAPARPPGRTRGTHLPYRLPTTSSRLPPRGRATAPSWSPGRPPRCCFEASVAGVALCGRLTLRKAIALRNPVARVSGNTLAQEGTLCQSRPQPGPAAVRQASSQWSEARLLPPPAEFVHSSAPSW